MKVLVTDEAMEALIYLPGSSSLRAIVLTLKEVGIELDKENPQAVISLADSDPSSFIITFQLDTYPDDVMQRIEKVAERVLDPILPDLPICITPTTDFQPHTQVPAAERR